MQTQSNPCLCIDKKKNLRSKMAHIDYVFGDKSRPKRPKRPKRKPDVGLEPTALR
jgi:hypothetical protein